jgi:transcriptional regulator
MYQPAHFREDDPARLHALIEAHAFGTLVGVDDAGVPEIAHLPFWLDRGAGVLRTHVARANPLAALAATGRAMTAVFHGPHGYVSPRWYSQPARMVPSWNYAVVHARGRVRVLDASELHALVGALAARYEADAAAPWRLADADAAVMARLERGIVGLELAIEQLDGKLKLSQNRAGDDLEGVVHGLRARGAPDDLAMLALMGK